MESDTNNPLTRPLLLNGRPAKSIPPKLEAFLRHRLATAFPDVERLRRDPVYALRWELDNQIAMIDSGPLFGAGARNEEYQRRGWDAFTVAIRYATLLRSVHRALPPLPPVPSIADARLALLGLVDWCAESERHGTIIQRESIGRDLDLLLMRTRAASGLLDPTADELHAMVRDTEGLPADDECVASAGAHPAPTPTPVGDDSTAALNARTLIVTLRVSRQGRVSGATLSGVEDRARVLASLRGSTAAHLLKSVLDRPGQILTWRELHRAGLDGGWWSITSAKTLPRAARRVREALPRGLRGHWEQDGAGVTWRVD